MDSVALDYVEKALEWFDSGSGKYVSYILMFLTETRIVEMVRYRPSSGLRLCLGFCPSLTDELIHTW